MVFNDKLSRWWGHVQECVGYKGSQALQDLAIKARGFAESLEPKTAQERSAPLRV
jgi:hypothetical protein